jgi:hypothetical protein
MTTHCFCGQEVGPNAAHVCEQMHTCGFDNCDACKVERAKDAETISALRAENKVLRDSLEYIAEGGDFFDAESALAKLDAPNRKGR